MKAHSVEARVEERANGWLKSYGLDYKLKNDTLNTTIDNALVKYTSKGGGKGGNYPDVKLLINDKYPVIIEYKGYKDKLVKCDSNGIVENKDKNNTPHFTNIKGYAVNGAIHYANAILHYTSYTEVIAVGMTGWIDDEDQLKHKIAVYYVSKENLGVGQPAPREYADLSFLAEGSFDTFLEEIRQASLGEEQRAIVQAQQHEEIQTRLTKLNNDIFKGEEGLSETARVYLVATTIIATLGIQGKIEVLTPEDLKSSSELNNRDGDTMMRKVTAFLKEKNLPEDKYNTIVDTLKPIITADNLNQVVNGETQLKRVFTKILDEIGIYYKVDLNTDFTGMLFNEMYSWIGFTKDTLNDVVLTPLYVAKLLVKLARVNRDSYVWDYATGSAGLLVAAMNEMIEDAERAISSPHELAVKKAHIKAEQLLGLEILPEIYVLAVLNMIMMGDGSSNILNRDSLKNFDGTYSKRGGEKIAFPANAFVLNPPYSARGKGMVFVEKAFRKMNNGGYGAVIIQNSAGNGEAKEYNKKILKGNTLLASIKMPLDLFRGKSAVQTYIYVFQVGLPHDPKHIVKFIDFSNDGYTRSDRKKASSSYKLKNTDHATERYEELVNLVHHGKTYLHYLTEDEYYESTIDPNDGADWNQSAPINTRPRLEDFKKTIADYLEWEVENLLREQGIDDALGK